MFAAVNPTVNHELVFFEQQIHFQPYLYINPSFLQESAASLSEVKACNTEYKTNKFIDVFCNKQ